MRKYILLLFVLILSSFVSAVTPYDEGLISYYAMDYNGNALDEVFNNNLGIKNVAYTASGKENGAYVYDGNGDYINSSSPLINENWTQGTFSMWVKFDTYAGKTHQLIYQSSAGDNEVQFKVDSGTINSYLFDSYWNSGVSLSSTTNWYHIVFTWDSDANERKLYIDSALNATNSSTFSTTATNRAFNIGGDNTGTYPTQSLDGTIDEVAIFNRTLNQTEINELYASGSGLFYDEYQFLIGNELYLDFDNNDPNDYIERYNSSEHGSPTYISGMLGNGLKCDGIDDYINSTYKFQLADNKTFALSMWMYIPDTIIDTASDLESIFGVEKAVSTYSYLFADFYNSGGIKLIRMFSLGGGGQSLDINFSYANITTDTWNHFVMEYDVSNDLNGSRKRLWVNGQLIGSNSLTAGIDATDISMFFCNHNKVGSPVAGRYLNTTMDEIGIWSRSLNTTEILQLYNEGIGYNPFKSGQVSSNLSYYSSITDDFDVYINISGLSGSANCTVYDDNVNITCNTSNMNSTNETLVNCVVGNVQNTNVVYTASCDNGTQYNESPSYTIFTNMTFDSLYNSSLNCSLNYSTLYTGSNIQFIHNVTDIVLTNINDSYSETMNLTNYIINNTDYMDKLMFNCSMIIDTYIHWKTVNISEGQINKILTFNYIGFGNSLISSTYSYFYNLSSAYYTNPTTLLLSSFTTVGNSNYYETLNISDLDFKHSDNLSSVIINESTATYNFSLTPNQMVLTFYQNGSLYNTSGVCVNDPNEQGGNMSYPFNNVTYLIAQQTFQNGYVKCKMDIDNNSNETLWWYQYYEYINDFTKGIDEDIEILQTADWTGYFRVTDQSDSPLKDVTIRAYFAYFHTDGTIGTKEFLGQRLTGDDGITFFYFDKSTDILLEVMKDGYDAYEVIIAIGDEDFSRDSPFNIALEESTTGVYNGAYPIFMNDWTFWNRTADVYGTMLAPYATTVTYITDYMIAQGLPNITASLSTTYTGRYIMQLISGTHFSNSNTDDIIVQIYVDGELWGNGTIRYVNQDDMVLDKSEAGLTDADSEYLFPILFIGLLIVSMLSSIIFSNVNVGITTFNIGVFILVFIDETFMWIGSIILLYYIIRGIYKIVSE